MDEFTSAGFTTGIKMLQALVVGFVFTAIALLSPTARHRTCRKKKWKSDNTFALLAVRLDTGLSRNSKTQLLLVFCGCSASTS